MELIQKCEICNKASWNKFSEKLIKCEGCGLLRMGDDVSGEKIDDIYNNGYFSGNEYADYLGDRHSLEINFKKRVKRIESLVDLSGVLLIEIGCAYGFFMNLMKGRVGKCIGFDVSREAVEYAKNTFGLEAYSGDFLAYDNEKADIVCMWDVIEHLPNPDEFINKISDVLKSGGYLCLTTGDSGSLVAKLRGDKWRLIHPPTHIFYFSRQTIEKLLNKHGFEVISIKHPSVYRNVGSIFEQIICKRNKEGKNNFILEKFFWVLKKIRINTISIGLNFFDIMEVIAIKK